MIILRRSLNSGWTLAGQSAIVKAIIVAIKRQIRASSVAAALRIAILVLTPDLDCVVALNHCKVLLPVVARIGSGNDWIALHTPDKRISGCSEVPQVINRWYSEVFFVLRAGTQRSCVDSQRIGVDIVIDPDSLRNSLLAESALQHLRRAYRPRVIYSR